MAVSPKVSAATVGAAFATMVVGILGVHVFPHGMPLDVQGLVTSALTAASTFGAGWFARAEPRLVANAEVVYTKVRQTAPTVEAIAEAVAKTEPSHVTLPLAQATHQA